MFITFSISLQLYSLTYSAMTCGKVCQIFCCPPCPSNIASKLAFAAPEPTYAVESKDNGKTYSFHLLDGAQFSYNEDKLNCIEVCKVETKHGHKICVMFVRCKGLASQYTLLISHGNAVDLGLTCDFLIYLSTKLTANILSYDYSGYGVSESKSSEKDLYYDIDAAYSILRTKYNVNPENIVLYGQSIGSVPTVDLATRNKVAAVVLHSPLMSGLRVACPDAQSTYCCDSFASIDKMHGIKSPVLVIHGTNDEVIDFSHGLEMYDHAPITVEPLWVEGADHNNIQKYGAYLRRLKKLLSVDIPQFQRRQFDQGSSVAAPNLRNS